MYSKHYRLGYTPVVNNVLKVSMFKLAGKVICCDKLCWIILWVRRLPCRLTAQPSRCSLLYYYLPFEMLAEHFTKSSPIRLL